MTAMYLGNGVERKNWQVTADKHFLDVDALLTHAFCVGMTGSGKTGLCIDVIEEAALQGKAVLLVDFKGDLSNIALQFPTFEAQEYLPYISETVLDENERQEQAQAVAAKWRENLLQAGIEPSRLQALQAQAEFRFYTPGSNIGRPISVLNLLGKTAASGEDLEVRQSTIGSAVRALLNLLALDSDVQSREFILLSNIFNYFTEMRTRDTAVPTAGAAELTLYQLIKFVQEPPFSSLGVMDLELFYPKKDRMNLALKLNALLANPQFSKWLEGETLDMQRLLYTDAGKPCVTIVSLQHLAEEERHFFLTLLLNNLLSWLNLQGGSSKLRALLYIDEIFGYLPPVANPPCKQPLLTLLKQARAFGLGVLLSSQNPVDLDYKALANCGTWWIGHLQTERDQQRLLTGLRDASSMSSFFAGQDEEDLSALIAALPKRTFLQMSTAHEGLQLFRSRQTMAFLAGPLSRKQRSVLAASLTASANADKQFAAESQASSLATDGAGLPFAGAVQDKVSGTEVVGSEAMYNGGSEYAANDLSYKSVTGATSNGSAEPSASSDITTSAAGAVAVGTSFTQGGQGRLLGETLHDVDSSLPIYFLPATVSLASAAAALPNGAGSRMPITGSAPAGTASAGSVTAVGSGTAAGSTAASAASATTSAASSEVQAYKPYLYAKVSYYFSGGTLSSVSGAQTDFGESLYLPLPEQAALIDWTQAQPVGTWEKDLITSKPQDAYLEKLPLWAKKITVYKQWQKKLQEYIYRTRNLEILYNPKTKLSVTAAAGSAALFELTAQAAAKDSRIDKMSERKTAALRTFDNRIMTAENAVKREQAESKASDLNTAISIGASVLGGLGKLLGGRNASGTLRSVNRSVKQRGDVKRAEEKLAELLQLRAECADEWDEKIAALQAELQAEYQLCETRALTLKRSDINVEVLGLLWMR